MRLGEFAFFFHDELSQLPACEDALMCFDFGEKTGWGSVLALDTHHDERWSPSAGGREAAASTNDSTSQGDVSLALQR